RLLEKREVADCMADQQFRECLNGSGVGGVFEHERIEFASFPHEWPPQMLHAAGELTLDIAQQALAANYNLKDAAPANVLFRGSLSKLRCNSESSSAVSDFGVNTHMACSQS